MGTVLIIGHMNYFPALAFEPLIEHVLLRDSSRLRIPGQVDDRHARVDLWRSLTIQPGARIPQVYNDDHRDCRVCGVSRMMATSRCE
jgi:hypothetical protein